MYIVIELQTNADGSVTTRSTHVGEITVNVAYFTT